MIQTKWINKLNIDIVEQPDGSSTFSITWDDEDPDLVEWNSWGEEGQRAFVMDSLRYALENQPDSESNGL